MRGSPTGARPAWWLPFATAGWVALVALTAGAPSLPSPLAAVTLSLLLVLILPGALLLILLDLRGVGLVAGFPLAFLLGFGLWSAPAVLLTAFRHESLGSIAWFVAGATGALLLGAWLRRRSRRVVPDAADARSGDGSPGGTSAAAGWIHRLVSLSAVALMVVLVSRYAYPEEDRYTYLAFLRHILDADAIFTKGFIIDPAPFLSARDLFQPWLVLQGLVIRLAGADMTVAYDLCLPLLLVPLSYAGIYLFSRELFEEERAGHLACVAQTLLLLSSYTNSLGRGFVTRIGEDKFLVVQGLLYPALWLALRFLKTGKRRFLGGLALGALGVVLAHPLGVVFLGISLGALAVPGALLRRERSEISRTLGILALWAACALMPLWQRQQVPKMASEPTHYTFDLAEGLSGPWKSGREGRLLVFSAERQRYIVSPAFLAPPLLFLSLLLSPVTLRDLRRRRSAQYLFGMTAAILVICYVPWVTSLFGRLLTPWMLWRLTWLLPAATTLVLLGLKAAGPGGGPGAAVSLRRELLPLALLACGGLFLHNELDRSFLLMRSERASMIDPDLRGALDYLRERGTPGSTILTPKTGYDNQIPLFVGHSFGLTFRAERQVSPQVREQRRRFFEQDRLDAEQVGFLRAYGVDVLLLERGTRLASLCSALPEIFPARYANDTYAVYGYRREIPPERERDALLGYTLLARGDLAGARGVFDGQLAHAPSDPLARIGGCDAAQAAGDVVTASACFERLAELLPRDPWVLVRAGDLARLVPGRDRRATQVGFYLRAIQAAPGDQMRHVGVRRGLAAQPPLESDIPGVPALREAMLPALRDSAERFPAMDRFQQSYIRMLAQLGLAEQARRQAEAHKEVQRRLAAGGRLQQRIAGMLFRAAAKLGRVLGWEAAGGREARSGVSAARC